VDSFQPNVMVPEQFIQPDGQITLNISPGATGGLSLGDEAIEFNARFGGTPHNVYIPCRAVLAIFAKETGEGTGFNIAPPEAADEQTSAPARKPTLTSVATPVVSEVKSPDQPKKKGSHLSVVK
jgi:stringent starvation protein B